MTKRIPTAKTAPSPTAKKEFPILKRAQKKPSTEKCNMPNPTASTFPAPSDQYKVDEDYAEYNAYRRMVEHAQEMEMQRDAARGIVLACHRAFIGGSDFCQSEARRLSADLVRKISLPNHKNQP